MERLGHRCRAVADAQLGVDVQQVGLDRRFADEQPGGRLPVDVAGGGAWLLRTLRRPRR